MQSYERKTEINWFASLRNISLGHNQKLPPICVATVDDDDSLNISSLSDSGSGSECDKPINNSNTTVPSNVPVHHSIIEEEEEEVTKNSVVTAVDDKNTIKNSMMKMTTPAKTMKRNTIDKQRERPSLAKQQKLDEINKKWEIHGQETNKGNPKSLKEPPPIIHPNKRITVLENIVITKSSVTDTTDESMDLNELSVDVRLKDNVSVLNT